MLENFNVNFKVSFNIFLEQSSCAFSWIDKRRDGTKLHGKTVKTVKKIIHSPLLYIPIRREPNDTITHPGLALRNFMVVILHVPSIFSFKLDNYNTK